MSNQVLLIDDEPDILELLAITLDRMSITCDRAPTLTKARELLSQNNYQLCLTDMKLPDGNGIDLVKEIQCSQNNLPTAVFTAHGNMDTAIEAMKAGAYDFITKPVDLEQLRQLVKSALATHDSQLESSDTSISDAIVGQSDVIIALRKKIKKLARSQAPVFISGESGSGKELVARAIHQQGARAQSPFVAVNCGAIPTELMESEFFGHRKGSFTGAQKDKLGLFQSAQGGTLFLDEVADLPLDMQVKLLRAIQEKAIRAIGDSKETAIDVRILSASHKDLNRAIEAGDFRSDLYYRINVIELDVPPLRDRGDDIILLSNFFLQAFAEEYDDQPAELASSAQQLLKSYNFPGNVRELRNILERAYTLCESDTIEESDLKLIPGDIATETDPADTEAGGITKQAGQYDESVSLDEYLEDIEKEILLASLDKHRWNRTNTAKALGITFRSLRYRLKKLGLDNDDA